MDASDVVTIVKDQVDAYNTRDIDGVMRYYADDAVILDGFGAVIAEGRDGIRAVYERVFTNNPELHADIPTAFSVGNWVAIHSIAANWAMQDGSRQQMQWIEVYQVSNEKIKRVQLFR